MIIVSGRIEFNDSFLVTISSSPNVLLSASPGNQPHPWPVSARQQGSDQLPSVDVNFQLTKQIGQRMSRRILVLEYTWKYWNNGRLWQKCRHRHNSRPDPFSYSSAPYASSLLFWFNQSVHIMSHHFGLISWNDFIHVTCPIAAGSQTLASFTL